jgi:hypothetical protein
MELGFPESFIRRWDYYFSYCQAGFAQHYIDDLQLVLTRTGNRDLIHAFDQKMSRRQPAKDDAK